MRNRRNTYKRRKTRRGTKRKQRRIFSRRIRKQRKMQGGGIPNDNITKGLRDSDIVAPVVVDSDGYSEAPTMRKYGDYMKEQV